MGLGSAARHRAGQFVGASACSGQWREASNYRQPSWHDEARPHGRVRRTQGGRVRSIKQPVLCCEVSLVVRRGIRCCQINALQISDPCLGNFAWVSEWVLTRAVAFVGCGVFIYWWMGYSSVRGTRPSSRCRSRHIFLSLPAWVLRVYHDSFMAHWIDAPCATGAQTADSLRVSSMRPRESSEWRRPGWLRMGDQGGKTEFTSARVCFFLRGSYAGD